MDVATFKARYTEFNDVADEVVAVHLEECATLLSVDKYGAKYNQALALLVAHELKLIEIGVDDYEVELSRSIAGGGRTIKNIATTDYQLYYSRSAYGSKFLALKKTIRFSGAVLCE
jgi:hypothetical protein